MNLIRISIGNYDIKAFNMKDSVVQGVDYKATKVYATLNHTFCQKRVFISINLAAAIPDCRALPRTSSISTQEEMIIETPPELFVRLDVFPWLLCTD